MLSWWQVSLDQSHPCQQLVCSSETCYKVTSRKPGNMFQSYLMSLQSISVANQTLQNILFNWVAKWKVHIELLIQWNAMVLFDAYLKEKYPCCWLVCCIALFVYRMSFLYLRKKKTYIKIYGCSDLEIEKKNEPVILKTQLLIFVDGENCISKKIFQNYGKLTTINWATSCFFKSLPVSLGFPGELCLYFISLCF